MPYKQDDNTYKRGRSRARAGQFVADLYTKPIVDRQFQNLSISGTKLVELDQISAAAGVIPAANIPASGGYFTEAANLSFYGNTNAATPGNARGARSVDIQSYRFAATQVASAGYATAVGLSLTVSGLQATVVGNYQAVTQTNGVAMGSSNYNYGQNSITIGSGQTIQSGANDGILIGSRAASTSLIRSNTTDAIGIGHYVVIGGTGANTAVGAIGIGASVNVSGSVPATYSTVVGYNGNAQGVNNTVVGAQASSGLNGTNNIVFGYGSSVANGLSYAGAIGPSITNTVASSIKIGPNNTDVIIVDNTSTAGQTNLQIRDVDNAAVERVTVGAADSGGAGFKVLRIPN